MVRKKEYTSPSEEVRITLLVLLGIYLLYAFSTIGLFYSKRKDYFIQKRAVGLSIVGAFCNALLIVLNVTRYVFYENYPCLLKVIIMEIASPMLLICSLLARGLHLFFEYQSNRAKLEEGMENSFLTRKKALSMNVRGSSFHIQNQHQHQHLANYYLPPSSTAIFPATSSDDMALMRKSVITLTSKKSSPFLTSSYSPNLRSSTFHIPSSAAAVSGKKKISFDDLSLPSSAMATKTTPSVPTGSTFNMYSYPRKLSASPIRTGLIGSVGYSSGLGVSGIRNTSLFGIEGSFPDVQESESGRVCDDEVQTSAQWYKNKRNHVPLFVFITFIVHLALTIFQIYLSKMNLWEISKCEAISTSKKDFVIMQMPSNVLMGIYALIGLPFLLYKLGPVKDAFGMKSDLFWTIFLGIPSFCLYMVWKKSRSMLVVNAYFHSSFLMCLFLICFHTLIITFPLTRAYRYRRKRNYTAGSVSPNMSPFVGGGSYASPAMRGLNGSSFVLDDKRSGDGLGDLELGFGQSVSSSGRKHSNEASGQVIRRASIFELINSVNSIEDVFDNESLLELFRDFAVTEFSVENLFFYEDFRRLKELINFLHFAPATANAPGTISTVPEYDPVLGGEEDHMEDEREMAESLDFRSHSAPEAFFGGFLAASDDDCNDHAAFNGNINMEPISSVLESSRNCLEVNDGFDLDGAKSPIMSNTDTCETNALTRPITHPKILDLIMTMYKRFIVPGSSHELNLNESTRRPIVEAIERQQILVTIFDGAAEEIVILMTSWTLPRFLAKQKESFPGTRKGSKNAFL